MKRRAAAAATLAAAVPVKADAGINKPGAHTKGCNTQSCDVRVGRRWWRNHHPRAHAASIVAPYRAWLAKVRRCESGGNYQTNTANGFYGAYQFTLGSWAAVGGTGLPSNAPPAEQDYRAVLLLRAQGPRAWPVLCAMTSDERHEEFGFATAEEAEAEERARWEASRDEVRARSQLYPPSGRVQAATVRPPVTAGGGADPSSGTRQRGATLTRQRRPEPSHEGQQ